MRTAWARVEAHLARTLAFDFEPGVNAWRRACAAPQGWYCTRGRRRISPARYRCLLRQSSVTSTRRLQRLGRDESTFKDSRVTDWTQ